MNLSAFVINSSVCMSGFVLRLSELLTNNEYETHLTGEDLWGALGAVATPFPLNPNVSINGNYSSLLLKGGGHGK